MDVRTTDLGDLTLRSIAVSAMDNNVYLLTHRTSGAQVLIDAAADAPAILKLLAAGASDVTSGQPARLIAILTTHSHWDHIRALSEVKSLTGAKAGSGVADAAAIGDLIDFTVDHGDVGNFDGFDLEAIGLRGHTPGSTAFALRPAGHPVQLFTGDSLFPGGVGKTHTAADFTSLIGDVTERIFDQFPDDAVVWPGHGRPTTLAAERPHLHEWRARGW